MKPTPAQVREALANHQRPGRTHAAKVREALQHARMSKEKPAAFEEANGLTDNTYNVRTHYGPNPT